MVSQPKPATERIESRISSLKESARAARNGAAGYAGMLAIDTLLITGGIAAKNAALAIVGSIAGVCCTVMTVHEGLASIVDGQTASALEGALAQHELSAAPFIPSQHSHFIDQPSAT